MIAAAGARLRRDERRRADRAAPRLDVDGTPWRGARAFKSTLRADLARAARVLHSERPPRLAHVEGVEHLQWCFCWAGRALDIKFWRCAARLSQRPLEFGLALRLCWTPDTAASAHEPMSRPSKPHGWRPRADVQTPIRCSNQDLNFCGSQRAISRLAGASVRQAPPLRLDIALSKRPFDSNHAVNFAEALNFSSPTDIEFPGWSAAEHRRRPPGPPRPSRARVRAG